MVWVPKFSNLLVKHLWFSSHIPTVLFYPNFITPKGLLHRNSWAPRRDTQGLGLRGQQQSEAQRMALHQRAASSNQSCASIMVSHGSWIYGDPKKTGGSQENVTWEVGWSMQLPMQLANSNSLSTFNRPNWHSAHLKPPILLIPAWSATHILLVGFLLIAFALISRRVRRTGKVLVIWDGRTGGTGSFHVLLTVLALLVPCIVFQVSFVVSIMGTLPWRIPERVRENMHLMGNRDCATARGNKRLQLGLKTGEH